MRAEALIAAALALDVVAVSPAGALPLLAQAPVVRVALHLAATLACGAAFAWDRDGQRLATLMGALAACFPVLGPAGALYVTRRSHAREAHEREMLAEYRELVDVVTLEEELPEDAAPHFWAATWRILELTNFEAILAEHTETGVIASVFESAQKLDLPTACAFYRRSLGSRTAVTRYYASTALSRAEDRCDARLQKAQAAHAAAPDDLDAQLELGEARLGYAAIGEGADPVTLFHVQEAARVLSFAFESLPAGHPRHAAVRLALAQALLAAGDAAAARPHFLALVEAGAREGSVLADAADACVRCRDFVGVVHVLSTGVTRNPDSQLLRRLHAEWVGGAA